MDLPIKTIIYQRQPFWKSSDIFFNYLRKFMLNYLTGEKLVPKCMIYCKIMSCNIDSINIGTVDGETEVKLNINLSME